MSETMQTVNLLDRLQTYDTVDKLRKAFTRIPRYRPHVSSLGRLMKDLRGEMLELMNEMSDAQIQHALFAATHKFYKTNVRKRALRYIGVH